MRFDELRRANVARCEGAFHPIAAWSLGDWACAFAGEAGEACNVVKKLRRLDIGSGFRRDTEQETALLAALADEIADTVIYADLLAEAAGFDLGEAIRRKFNEVSDRVGSEVRL